MIATILSYHTYRLHYVFGIKCERMYEIPVITFRCDTDNPCIEAHVPLTE